MNKNSAVCARLEKLGIKLPKPKAPVGLYQSAIVDGGRLYISGHGPWHGDVPVIGKVGATMTVAEAQDAACLVGLGILATVDEKVGLENVRRLFRTFGMVNSSPWFKEHPRVIDGFSGLMNDVFGPDSGVGARSAVGVASLPFGIPVEIECEFILRS